MNKFITNLNILFSIFMTAIGSYLWYFILVMTTGTGSRTVANLGIYGLLIPAIVLQILSTSTSTTANNQNNFNKVLKATYLAPLLLIAAIPGYAVPQLFPFISAAFFYIWFRLHTSI